MKNWYMDWVFGTISGVSIVAAKGLPQQPEEAALWVGYAAFYAYCCRYLNPDLDVRGNRCGARTAPLGFLTHGLRRMRLRLLLRLVKPFQFVLNIMHNLIWAPFGYLFTHRGILHWPLIGTWLKASWLFLLVAPWLHYKGYDLLETYRSVILSPWYMIWTFADLSHILSDIMIAKILKRKAFVPPATIAPRGWLMKTLGIKSSRWFAI
ncbi:hypothetical protein [Oligoflexus tunisiensis]|uniref:hypothetical protein n=1 Tax=Oligoflexus tunisiensis TaxID=708132 RepID=UPI00114CF5A0|nr:hypothetical protein [Oligoflexus tunisiensis]